MKYDDVYVELFYIGQTLAKAILNAEQHHMNAHMAWHLLPSRYQHEALQERADQISTILIPTYRHYPGWEKLVPILEKLNVYMRYFEAGPIFGCPNCY